MAPPGDPKIRRFAILWNSSLPRKDGVAAYDRSFTRDFQPILLDQEKFDRIYRIDHECRTHDVRREVVCADNPSPEALQRVVNELKTRDKVGGDSFVYINVRGHGDASTLDEIGVDEFANIVGEIPPEVSRVTEFWQCEAGIFAELKPLLSKLVDDNDLLTADSGADELGRKGQTDVSILFAEDRDADGDRVKSFHEIFFGGRLSIFMEMFPAYRRFVYYAGPNFVDRGLGTKAATPPFPDRLVEVTSSFHYSRITNKITHPGVTLIAFEGRGGNAEFKKKLEEAAKEYRGTIQFLWVGEALAPRTMELKFLPRWQTGKSFFMLFYAGYQPELIFESDQNIDDVLHRLRTGQNLGGNHK